MIRDEKGVTLPELLLVLAIIAVIASALVGTIYQIFNVTDRGSSEMAVQHDLRNAAVWLNRDVLSASEAEVIGSEDEPQMVLTIPTFITSTINITYTYSTTTRGLVRIADTSLVTVARNIVSNPFPSVGTIITAPNVVTVNLVSLEGNVLGSGEFALKMRAGGSIQIVAACPITAEQFDVDFKTVSWVITNSGSDLATIKQIEIGWPSGNGALSMIKFGGIPIWAGDEPPTLATITKPLWQGEPENLTIAGGMTQKTLALDFELNAASDEALYSIEIVFDNGCIVSSPFD